MLSAQVIDYSKFKKKKINKENSLYLNAMVEMILIAHKLGAEIDIDNNDQILIRTKCQFNSEADELDSNLGIELHESFQKI